MKTSVTTFTLLLGLAYVSTASPIANQSIPDSAKWVAHLDLEQLQQTQLGGALVRQFVDPVVGQFAETLRSQIGMDMDWRKIHGITAYGTNLKKKPEAHTVLLIQSELPVQQALDAALKKFGEESTNKGQSLPLRKLDEGGPVLYAFGKEAFASFGEKGLLILGKSQRAVSNAVLLAQRPGALQPPTPGASDSKPADRSFFHIRLTDKFYEGLDLPAPAQVLKMTEGIRLSLGETADHLNAKLALMATTTEVVEQLQQALQGAVAMASLALTEQVAFQKWIKGIRVERQDREVDLALQLPLSEIFKFIDEKKPKKAAKR